jgi:hemerythrin superfamily protein
VPDPRTADGTLPEGADVDVIDLLLTQHARIEEQFLLVTGAARDAKRQAFDDLVRLLTVHETAEEEVVHPLSRTVADAGGALIDDRLQEERQAKEMLQALLDTDVHGDGFDASLLLLRNAVLSHARHEERYEFPQLRAKVPADRLRRLAEVVKVAESAAPARPHPGAETATANLVTGPALAVADEVRDLIREAGHRADS